MKRLIFNLSLIFMLILGYFLGVSVFKYFVFSGRADAVIISYTHPGSNQVYYVKSNGMKIQYDDIVLEYIVDGVTYTADSFALPGEYSIGDHRSYSYDKRDPSKFYYIDLETDFVFYGIPFVVCLVLLIASRSAIHGYYCDFILRYKKSFIYTCLSLFILIGYYLWFEYIFEAGPGFLSGLSEVLFLYFLYFWTPVSCSVVWIIAVICYNKKQKRLK